MNINYSHSRGPDLSSQSELDELDRKIKNKFIRNVVKPYNNDMPRRYIDQSQHIENTVQRTPIEKILPHPSFPSPQQVFKNQYQPYSPYTHVIRENYPVVHPSPIKNEISCRQINHHVQTCPVCTKIYTPYNHILMVIIVILVIIILFLIKKLCNY
jgi:hypothetical protein